MRAALDQTAALIGALDLSAENERVAALRTEVAEIEAAAERADSRLRAIGTALASRSGPDGAAVADALLSGADAADAAEAGPGDDALRAERETLRAGMGELSRRAELARREIGEIEQAATTKAAECVAPLAEALREEMRQAGNRIVEGFAAITAVQEATRGHGLARLAAESAVRGLMGQDKLLDYRRSATVPADIGAVLRPLVDKGPALRLRRVVSEVGIP